MTRNVVWIGRITSIALCLALTGCNAAKDPAKPASSGTTGGAATTGGEKAGGEKGTDAKSADGTSTAAAGGETWEGYPDVVKVPIMTEVDGIKIPRLETKGSKLQIKGALPVDVGNEHAAAKPSKPERGDWLVIRFNSEPKTLNPITETSAVQSYIGEYVQESLARQNPETMEFEPNVAKKLPRVGLVQPVQPRAPTEIREHGNLVVAVPPGVGRDRGVGQIIRRNEAGAGGRAPPHDQHPVEVQ